MFEINQIIVIELLGDWINNEIPGKNEKRNHLKEISGELKVKMN
jgi:hypothetical protein